MMDSRLRGNDKRTAWAKAHPTKLTDGQIENFKFNRPYF